MAGVPFISVHVSQQLDNQPLQWKSIVLIGVYLLYNSPAGNPWWQIISAPVFDWCFDVSDLQGHAEELDEALLTECNPAPPRLTPAQSQTFCQTLRLQAASQNCLSVEVSSPAKIDYIFILRVRRVWTQQVTGSKQVSENVASLYGSWFFPRMPSNTLVTQLCCLFLAFWNLDSFGSARSHNIFSTLLRSQIFLFPSQTHHHKLPLMLKFQVRRSEEFHCTSTASFQFNMAAQSINME